MVTQSFLFVAPDTFEPRSVTKANLRTVFILRLPYRVRVGTVRRLRMDPTLEVVFRNKFPIPQPLGDDGWDKLLWDGTRRRPREELFTHVLILDSKPEASDEEAAALATWQQDETKDGMPGYKKRYFAAHEALNDAIVAYHTATNHLINGYAIERLTDTDFFSALRFVHTVLCPAEYELTDCDLEQLLEARGEHEIITGGQFVLDLADASEDQLANLEKSLQLHRDYIFYQFALDAKSHMVQRDFMAALLYAVVALEGAHAVVLQLCLRRRAAEVIIDEGQCDKFVEEKANKLLMDVGFSAMLEMTSLLLLDKEDRLSANDIKACQQGITIRNEIMHALSRRGQYRLRNRRIDEINTAYSAVMKMYGQLVQIIEKRTE
jgi:hypothetical protein